jgi:hypothetical protein
VIKECEKQPQEKELVSFKFELKEFLLETFLLDLSKLCHFDSNN